MLFDVFMFLGLTILFYWLIIKTFFNPYERGFYCDDKSINKKLKDNTFSPIMLLIITLGLPLPLFFIINIFKQKSFKVESNENNNLIITTNLLDKIFKTTTYIYLDYVLGYLNLSIILEFIKCVTGRLRPNFIAMCKPNNLEICNIDPYAFIPSTNCTASVKSSKNSRFNSFK